MRGVRPLWEGPPGESPALSRKSRSTSAPTHNNAALTIILAGRCLDDDPCLRRRHTAKLADESLDARILRGEAMVIDEVLPGRPRVPPLTDGPLDEVAVRFAGARGRRPDSGPARW
jgi:hypothetical protein